jgi:hypothetical protein
MVQHISGTVAFFKAMAPVLIAKLFRDWRVPDLVVVAPAHSAQGSSVACTRRQPHPWQARQRDWYGRG